MTPHVILTMTPWSKRKGIIIEEIIEEEEYLENGYKLNEKQVKLYVEIKSLLDREHSDLSKEEVSQTFDYLLSDKIFNSKIFR